MRDLIGKRSWWVAVGLWTVLLMAGAILTTMEQSTSPPGVEDLQMAPAPLIRATAPPGAIAPMEALSREWATRYLDLAAVRASHTSVDTPVVSALLRTYKNGLPQWRLLEYRLTDGAVLFLPPCKTRVRSY